VHEKNQTKGSNLPLDTGAVVEEAPLFPLAELADGPPCLADDDDDDDGGSDGDGAVAGAGV
jgi:hypothetical protein